MAKLRASTFIVLAACLIAAGCTSTQYMTPTINGYPVKASQFPAINTTEMVKLENVQPSTEQVSMGKKGWVSDHNQWTDVAIGHVERAFDEAGIEVGDRGARVLKLAVTEARLEFGFTKSTCFVSLDLETGDGYKNRYEGSNMATAGMVYLPELACEGAAPRAIVKMLNDPGVLAYLE